MKPVREKIALSSSGRVRLLLVGEHSTPEMNSQPWELARFDVQRVIGRGYASRVYQCVDKVSGQEVALKVYHKANLCPLNFHQIKREMLIQSRLDHPNVLSIYAAFDDSENVYMVLEFAAKGDLYNYLRHKGRKLTEGQAAKYVIGPFLNVLHYIHGKEIIHRDIKPENLLLDASGSLKLADFGLSIVRSEENPVTRAGTVDYMAPEVVRCPRKRYHDEWKDRLDLVYTASVDIWALGVLVFELVIGHAPFKAPDKEGIQARILALDMDLPTAMTPQCQNFVHACLNKHAIARPVAAELMQHPWMTTYVAPKPPPSPRESQRPALERSSSAWSSQYNSSGDHFTRLETCGEPSSCSSLSHTKTSSPLATGLESPRIAASYDTAAPASAADSAVDTDSGSITTLYA